MGPGSRTSDRPAKSHRPRPCPRPLASRSTASPSTQAFSSAPGLLPRCCPASTRLSHLLSIAGLPRIGRRPSEPSHSPVRRTFAPGLHPRRHPASTRVKRLLALAASRPSSIGKGDIRSGGSASRCSLVQPQPRV